MDINVQTKTRSELLLTATLLEGTLIIINSGTLIQDINFSMQVKMRSELLLPPCYLLPHALLCLIRYLIHILHPCLERSLRLFVHHFLGRQFAFVDGQGEFLVDKGIIETSLCRIKFCASKV